MRSAWWSLARADWANVGRDPMLLGGSLAALPLGLLAGPAEPWLHQAVVSWVAPARVDAMLGAGLLVLPALLLGIVQGFLWLEERDEHVLPALQATPWGLAALWRWRLSAGFVGGWGCGLLAWVLSGRPLSIAVLAWACIGAAHAPLGSAVMGRLARDKVQGLALSKLTSLAAVAGISWMFSGPAAFLGAAFPAWWLTAALLGRAWASVPAWGLVALAACALAAHPGRD